MENGENGRSVFPLTSLQIGDLQSYLSHLSLYVATESNKFFILVDNQPWLEGIGSRPAHLWQYMVTKSRLSPFANTSAQKQGRFVKEKQEKRKPCSKGFNSCKGTKSTTSKVSKRWFSLVDAAKSSQKRALLPVKNLKYSLQLNHELHRTLFGLIVFEVSWSDVRGLNYLNELQTDTSLAVETKYMRRWEFDSIKQAVGCMSSWFSGTHHEQNILREYLLSVVEEVFYDAEEDFSDEETNCFYDAVVENISPYGVTVGFNTHPLASEENTSALHTPPPPNAPYKRRKVTISSNSGVKVGSYIEESPKTPKRVVDPFEYCEQGIEATEYKDALILFRFNDRHLPFKLRDIVMSDLRLLTLLESGLPSWVIFLQSYPVFCHLYRPWMCPLVRALYVVISIATVVIGFYDLYKNVPLLKATASRLFGPLFDWIETWEMVSRIKCLGTMLFLHNFQKAIEWFLVITRTVRSFFSVLAQPIIEPLIEFSKLFLPFWTMLIQLAEGFFTYTGIFIGLSCDIVGNIIEIVLLPIWLIFSFAWNTALGIILPILRICWEILYAPARLVLALASCLGFICTEVLEILVDLWTFTCSILSIASATETTVTTYEASIWRSLWNDLFSKVFRAVRSILNGFVAFFAACNRHRLSIYNHVNEFVHKLFRQPSRSQHPHHRRKQMGGSQHQPQIRRTQSAEAHDRESEHVKRL